MQQLSGSDTTSLYAEHGNIYNHVGTLTIYNPATCPGGKLRFKDVLAHFESCIDSHPVLRRRLVEVPLGMDRPYWVEETEIDVEFHVRHLALPEPGDWRDLMIQVARLHSRPLDRSRPLWEIYIIERLDNVPGLPKGSFAMFCKLHHASVDGIAAVHLLSSLHDKHPEDMGEAPRPRTRVGERTPLQLELATRAVVNSAARSFKIARLTTASAGKAVRHVLSPKSTALSWPKMPDLRPAPYTRFSEKVSPHRVVEGLGLPMSSIRSLRAKVPGVTINDVFLALTGGAMRNYLQDQGELPERALSALMPVSLRASGEAGGNDVTGVAVTIASDIADPLERLRAVHESASQAVGDEGLFGLDMAKQVLDLAPLPLSNALVTNIMLPQLNTTVSNVRGPAGPLYLAGAQLQRLYPVSIAADHAGINHTAISYDDYFWIGVVSCRQMLPDPEVYMNCLRDAYQSMLAAADLPPVTDPEFTNTKARRSARKTRKKKAA